MNLSCHDLIISLRDNLLPRRPGQDILSPGRDAGASVEERSHPRGHEIVEGGEVVEVRQREGVAAQVYGLREAGFVHIENLSQLSFLLLYDFDVRGKSLRGLDGDFPRQL